ncbi:uncharacterized protein LOC127248832 [Andrographis paniculata]|uniref:uncharacterized protein LOC127248832 n=1 Tax=Andrographis paniculata TaxID=175694 RepID=UPI0021E6DB7F|nr:uncharacterized protein LOC127248832 [Andrographis paniculata]
MVRISSFLSKEQQEHMITLIRRNMECLAWDYSEIPGLARRLIEHRLPIKNSFMPYKQPPRRINPELLPQIKEEFKKLLKAGFIRPCRYADWLANIVPVTKKNGKIRICIDFRDFNLATPKDEYVMPVVDMLIDSAAGYKILSLMDGYVGYNHIFMAEEDTPKTAFRCPGALGIYEWTSMKVYIDDVRVKSADFSTHLGDLENAFAQMKRNISGCQQGQSNSGNSAALNHQGGSKFPGKADFIWGSEQHEAFEAIKQALAEPPVLVPPKEHYILPREIEVVSEVDLVKLLLHQPTMQGRLMKWAIKLAPFSLKYRPLKAMKGQAVADLLVEFTRSESEDNELVPYIGIIPWWMFFDGSRANRRSGLQMEEVTHNSAEYEALILGLEMLVAKNVQSVVIYGDS